MGLGTIDSHSHKVQTKFYKIPKFVVTRPNSNQDTAICRKISKFTKKGMVIRTLSEHSVQMAVHFFVNFDVFCCISVKTSLINTKLKDFVNF